MAEWLQESPSRLPRPPPLPLETHWQWTTTATADRLLRGDAHATGGSADHLRRCSVPMMMTLLPSRHRWSCHEDHRRGLAPRARLRLVVASFLPRGPQQTTAGADLSSSSPPPLWWRIHLIAALLEGKSMMKKEPLPLLLLPQEGGARTKTRQQGQGERP